MSVGVWQVFLVLIMVLIVFGAGKLPKVMEDISKSIRNIRNDSEPHSSNEPDR